MEYEIVKHRKNFFIRIQVGITKEEYEKLKKVSNKVAEHVKKDLMIDSITVTSAHVTFVKEFKELGVITSKDVHEFEKSISEFFQWLRDYQIPEAEPECPNHDTDEDCEATNEEELNFVKSVLSDMVKDENSDGIISAKLLGIVSDQDGRMVFPVGTIGGRTLKKCLQAYVRLYDKG
jgi:hypothetical protein